MLVFTGGSSTSGVDLVRKVLNDMGATYLFESVDVRPGHPALAARLPVPEKGPNSGRERFVLGLPGNPLAAYTALYSYLPPLLAGMRDMSLPELDSAVLGDPVDTLRAGGASSVYRCRCVMVWRIPLPKSASHMLSSLAAATHCAVLDDSSVWGSAHEVGLAFRLFRCCRPVRRIGAFDRHRGKAFFLVFEATLDLVEKV